MARRPRVAPDFTPEELEQVEAAKDAVLNNYSARPAPKPVPISPSPGGMGQRGGKAGGFWYAKGGAVKNYCKGGKVIKSWGR
jgi:hypothetical protein